MLLKVEAEATKGDDILMLKRVASNISEKDKKEKEAAKSASDSIKKKSEADDARF